MPSLSLLLQRTPSLRRVFLLPNMLLILSLALVIGWLSYQAGSQALENVAHHLLRKSVQGIAQQVERHLLGSAQVLEAAFPQGVPVARDIARQQARLTERLWIATSLHPGPLDYVYYANRDGQAIGLLRRSADEGELRLCLSRGEHRRIYRIGGPLEQPQLQGTEEQLFAPRTRPWYRLGLESRRDAWTKAYPDFVSRELVITRVRGVPGEDGDFAGVVATDVPLRDLDILLRNLDISANGLAFIIEPNGELIAASRGGNVLSDRHIGPQRLNAENSPEPLVRELYAELRRHLNPSARTTPPSTAFGFVTGDGKTLHAAFQWIRDDAGLAWIAVVAMPRSDFTGSLANNALRTALVAAVAVLVTLLLGAYLANWVIADIARLSRAAERIGRGQTNVNLQRQRRDEIGQLARSFAQMQRELSTDQLTGLCSRAALVRQLEFALRRRRNDAPAEDGFALLFIDLNGFKLINDSLGHDVGDRVLAEVAERLRAAVRPSDLVARLGGDEFVIVLWRVTTHDVVRRIAEQIGAALQIPLACLEHLVEHPRPYVGAAIGTAFYPRDGRDVDSLLRRADRSCTGTSA